MIGDKRTSFHPTPVLKFEESFLVFWKAVREVSAVLSILTSDEVYFAKTIFSSG
jgi:hypothetical protein